MPFTEANYKNAVIEIPQKEEVILMANSNLSISVNSELKEQAQAVLDDLGLDMTTAFNLFLRQIIYKEAIPFEIARPKNKNSTRPPFEYESMAGEIRMANDIKPRPIFGSGRGKMWIADDFDAPLDELKEYME